MPSISEPSETELLNIDDYFTTIYEKVFEYYNYSKPGKWDLNDVTDVRYREFSDREIEQSGNINIFLKFVDKYLLNVDIEKINSLANLIKYKKALEFIINKFQWLVGDYLEFIGDETCDEIRKIYAKPTKRNPKPNEIKKAQFYANANTRCRFKAMFEPKISSAQKVLDKILEKIKEEKSKPVPDNQTTGISELQSSVIDPDTEYFVPDDIDTPTYHSARSNRRVSYMEALPSSSSMTRTNASVDGGKKRKRSTRKRSTRKRSTRKRSTRKRSTRKRKH